MRLSLALALAYGLLMRLAELVLSKRNARRLGAAPVAGDGFLAIAAVHALWFVGLVVEERLIGPRWDFSPLLLAVFGVTELVRFSCVLTLGRRWNIRVLELREPPIDRGLYRWLAHPNL